MPAGRCTRTEVDDRASFVTSADYAVDGRSSEMRPEAAEPEVPKLAE
jgi:hypothetical protein